MKDITLVRLVKLYPVIEEKLKSGGKVQLTTTGKSMWPLFHHRKDAVILVAPTFPLKKGDLPLHRRDTGRFVLHRVIGKNADGYIIRGDNCTYTERGIRDDQILAVVESYTRNGKFGSPKSFGYKLYSFLYCNDFVYYIRRYCHFGRKKLARIYHKYIKKDRP